MACQCNPMSAQPGVCDCLPPAPPPMAVSESQCLSSILRHTGVCIDPTNVNPPPENCRRHQAPAGYRYVMQNGVCVLVNLRANQIVTATGVVPYVPNPPLSTAGGAGDVVANGLNWIQNNKGLAAGIALAIVLIVKNK